MTRIIIPIGGYAVTADCTDQLITYALGSCIAVILYDPIRTAGGMIHYMLPLSSTNPEKAAVTPAMFADTGVPLLFHSMYELGCKKGDLVVKIAGGGQLYDDNGTFEIGKRNITILRRMLWKSNVLIATEDVGGAKSRTVSLEVGSGRCVVKSQLEEYEL
jgi:chemotaxis protein CheD